MFKRFSYFFNFWDFRIGINFSLLFGIGFIWYVLSHSYFWDWIDSFLFSVSLYFCIALHELGHYYAARKYGVKTEGMVLHFLGATLLLSEQLNDPRVEGAVSAAGPVVSILLSFLFINLYFFSEIDFFNYLSIANFIIFLFNMLPVYPMDGGRMLKAFLSFFISPEKALFYAKIPTYFFLAVLAFFALKELFFDRDFLSFLKYYSAFFFISALAFSGKK